VTRLRTCPRTPLTGRTQRGKLHGVVDFVVHLCLGMEDTALLVLVPLAPHDFPFAPLKPNGTLRTAWHFIS
jgi:hypothetical protein